MKIIPSPWYALIAGIAIGIVVMFLLCEVAHSAGAESTAYSPCSAGTIMADGTHVRPGSVAMNTLPLGTRIYVPAGGPDGLKKYTVRDRIGAYSQLDFWVADCGLAIQWGRRYVEYFVGWPKSRGKVKAKRVAKIPKKWLA